MKLNNKGFTLIEAMAACTIMGIVAMWGTAHLLTSTKITNKNVKKSDDAIARYNAAIAANPAIAPGADQRTYLPGLNVCTKLGGAEGIVGGVATQWYAKRTDTRVVSFFKNSPSCTSGGIGTLTAQTNPTYDEDQTNTFWNVSGDGNNLRVLVRKLNVPK